MLTSFDVNRFFFLFNSSVDVSLYGYIINCILVYVQRYHTLYYIILFIP